MTISAYPKRYGDFGEAFNALLDDAVKERETAAREARYKDRRPSVGGSRLGPALVCARQIAYEWHQTAKDVGRGFSGRTYRIFERGHDGEERMAHSLTTAGFDLSTKTITGGQYGFGVARDPETGEPRIKGFADGIIRSGPERVGPMKMKYPMLWENKVVKHSKWLAMKNKGLRTANWDYFVQCQVYMAYLELPRALFTAVDADLMSVYAEIIQYDAEVAQRASDIGVQIVKSKRPEDMPRGASDSTNHICKWCDYTETCWSQQDTKGEVQQQEINKAFSAWTTKP